jgi:hypothetical protein
MRMANKVMDTMASCFDDGANGIKSKKLVASLSSEELKLMYDQIFAEDVKTAPEAAKDAQDEPKPEST